MFSATFFKVSSIVLALSIPSLSHAETAADFLESLEGNYSGRGQAVVLGEDVDKVACKINGRFDKGSAKLTLTGECASTKGKATVNGGISANKNTLKGAFVSPRQGVRVTQSSGTFRNGRIQLSASMMDDKVGRLIKVRQVISKSKSGINAQFFTYDNATKKYKSSGTIKLKKR